MGRFSLFLPDLTQEAWGRGPFLFFASVFPRGCHRWVEVSDGAGGWNSGRNASFGTESPRKGAQEFEHVRQVPENSEPEAQTPGCPTPTHTGAGSPPSGGRRKQTHISPSKALRTGPELPPTSHTAWAAGAQGRPQAASPGP